MDFTEGSNLSEDYGYITQSMSSLQVSRPESRGSISSSQGLKTGGREVKAGSIGKKKKRMSDSIEENVLKSLKEEMEDGHLEDIEETDGVYSSSIVSAGGKLSRREPPIPGGRKGEITGRSRQEDVNSLSGSVRQLPNNPPSKSAFNGPTQNDLINGEKNISAFNGMDGESQKPGFCTCFHSLLSLRESCLW